MLKITCTHVFELGRVWFLGNIIHSFTVCERANILCRKQIVGKNIIRNAKSSVLFRVESIQTLCVFPRVQQTRGMWYALFFIKFFRKRQLFRGHGLSSLLNSMYIPYGTRNLVKSTETFVRGLRIHFYFLTVFLSTSLYSAIEGGGSATRIVFPLHSSQNRFLVYVTCRS